MSEHSGMPGKTPYQEARFIASQRRQADRDERTPDEQLALLDQRPGQSKRERARLAK